MMLHVFLLQICMLLHVTTIFCKLTVKAGYNVPMSHCFLATAPRQPQLRKHEATSE